MVVEVGDAGVLGVPGHVDHLTGVQQTRVVHRHGQVGLDEARRRPMGVAGENLRVHGLSGLTWWVDLGYPLHVLDDFHLDEIPPRNGNGVAALSD